MALPIWGDEMQHFKTLLACMALIGGLAACVSKPEPLAPVQGVQRIGIASAIGGQLQYRQIAALSTANDSEVAAISDWGFDEYIEGEAAARLQARYVIESISVDRSAQTASAIALAAASTRMNDPLDAYLVIVPAQRPPRLVRERQAANSTAGSMFGAVGMLMTYAAVGDGYDYAGLGMYKPSGDTNGFVYALADLVLVDGRTFLETRRVPLIERAYTAGTAVIEGAQTLSDMRAVESGSAWPVHFSQFSGPQLQSISDNMAILLGLSLSYSLAEMGLTQEH